MATATYSFDQINGPDVLNAVTTGYQNYPVLVTYANGAGVVFFSTEGAGIAARLIDSQGNPTGPQISVSTGSNPIQADAALLSNGNVVLTWAQGAPSSIVARIFTPDLQPVGGLITVQTGLSNQNYYEPDVTAMANGGFAIAGFRTIGPSTSDIHIKTYNASGVFQNTTGASAPAGFSPAIATLTDGNIALAFNRYNGPQTETDLWTAIYSPTLGIVRAPTLLDSSGNHHFNPDVDALPDGSFLISEERSTGSNIEVVTARLSATGASLDTDITGTTTAYGPSSAVSPTGHTVVVMEGDTHIRATLLLANGTIGAQKLALQVDGNQVLPAVTWTNPYTIQLAYTASSGADGDGSDQGIAVSRFLVVRTTSSDASGETLTGDALIDVMFGNAGNDTMDGGGGPDTMHGGAGDDTYYVESGGDVVDEGSPGSSGYDTVVASFGYTLGFGVDALVLSGSAAAGTGNDLANLLTGNAAANILDGSYGADLMRGLGGNDVYVVDDAGDVVDEIAPGSGGYDSVLSSVDHELGPNLEALTLTGTGKIDGRGNGLGNTLFGNGAINKLSGGGGDDLLRGGGGKDTLDGGGGSDTADYSDMAKAVQLKLDGSKMVSVKIGGKSEDQLKNVENVTGGLGKDKLVGDGKANMLDGLLGKDTLSGGAGKDKFLFDTGLGSDNADSITDFKHKQDKLALDDAIFAAIGVKLDKAEFYAKAGARKAHDASDRIVYDSSTGKLYYDDDGKGGHTPAAGGHADQQAAAHDRRFQHRLDAGPGPACQPNRMVAN